jgi:hypothetical protein
LTPTGPSEAVNGSGLLGKSYAVSAMAAAGQARRLVEYRPGHPVISLYMDLDPEQFATPPARAAQIRSLIDQAHRNLEAQNGLSHADRVALKADIARIDDFLSSPEAPFKGVRALAVFCSGQAELFEVVPLSRPTEARAVIRPSPYVEPLVAALQMNRWLVALVSRHDGRVLAANGSRSTCPAPPRSRSGARWRSSSPRTRSAPSATHLIGSRPASGVAEKGWADRTTRSRR